MENTQKVTYERKGRHILFTVPKSLNNKPDTAQLKQICGVFQENQGFHPAAYGQPYDIVDKGETIEFKCSSSSD